MQEQSTQKTDLRRAERKQSKSSRIGANGARKNQASAGWARAGRRNTAALNTKFVKIIKRLYLAVFCAIYPDCVKRVCPSKNIGGNAVYLGFVSLMEQLFSKYRRSRDRLARGACGVLYRCDADG